MNSTDESSGDELPITIDTEEKSKRDRLEAEAERAIDGFDRGIVDLLAWLLKTETRSRIYVYLRKYPDSTSEEIASGTGLYPSTVREALAELHDEETVTRQKRESAGAGNNPYEYRAISPSELVGGMVGQLQDQLNGLINLDRHLRDDEPISETEPITITVDEDDEQYRGGQISRQFAEWARQKHPDPPLSLHYRVVACPPPKCRSVRLTVD